MAFSTAQRPWAPGRAALQPRLPFQLSRTGGQGAFTRHRRTPLTVTSVLREEAAYLTPGGVVDYYEILGVDDDASQAEIKAAYRALAKVCHPDTSGDRGHDMCILLNEAYSVLMDDQQRVLYNQQLEAALLDAEDGYTGEILSKWMCGNKMGKNSDPAESRAVFVDEITCIGCKQCVWCAPATFRIEQEFGRSRVFAQWLDTEDNLQAAIDSCPVSCIHWVDKEQLPALEFVTRFKTPRTNVGVMMAGQGGYIPDVFDATTKFLKERQRREEARQAATGYSAAQEAARRAAAAEVARRQWGDGWFNDVFKRFALDSAAKVMADAIRDQVLGNPDSAPSEDAGAGRRVGTRKRNRWGAPATGGFGAPRRAPIPADRALVPVAVKQEPWRRAV